MVLDNIDVAIITKLNELAERRGLKPYDFVAVVRHQEAGAQSWMVLDFEVAPHGNALREERFDKMLDDLGVGDGDSTELRGDPQQIIDALDHALSISPRRRDLF